MDKVTSVYHHPSVKPIRQMGDEKDRGYIVRNKFRTTKFIDAPEVGLVQGTGMGDMKGLQIFEGDLVKTKELYGRVKYKDGAFEVKWLNMPGDQGMNWDFLRDVHDHVRVVSEDD